MNTKFVGVKDFRQNIAKYARTSKRKNERLVILNRNTPILEVRPISDEENFTMEFRRGIEQGLKDVKAGRVYTLNQIEKELGL